jgi:uncharacterized protein (DUF1501 family)
MNSFSLSDILSTAGELPPDAGTLVLITLYGGNDGLNTVIPFADRRIKATGPACRSAPTRWPTSGSATRSR